MANQDRPMKQKTLGTPKSLTETIAYAISTVRFGSGIDTGIAHFRSIIRDYLAQKFAAAYIKASPEQLEALEELWSNITKEMDI